MTSWRGESATCCIELARRQPGLGFGYLRIQVMLQREGWEVNK
jgi:hypothetical protein